MVIDNTHSPVDQICCHVTDEDLSVRAPNWFLLKPDPTLAVSTPTPLSDGSAGAQSSVPEWSKFWEEWKARIQHQVVTKSGFIPKTPLGRRLLELRNKYVAEGGKLLRTEEIQSEVARRRREME